MTACGMSTGRQDSLLEGKCHPDHPEVAGDRKRIRRIRRFALAPVGSILSDFRKSVNFLEFISSSCEIDLEDASSVYSETQIFMMNNTKVNLLLFNDISSENEGGCGQQTSSSQVSVLLSGF